MIYTGHLPTSYSWPSYSTDGKGLPVAINALPCVHLQRSLGCASWSFVGLLSGSMIGLSTCFAISLTNSSLNVFGHVEVPIRTFGFTSLITESRSLCGLFSHSESSRAKGICPSVRVLSRDLSRSPGLSTHLDRSY